MKIFEIPYKAYYLNRKRYGSVFAITNDPYQALIFAAEFLTGKKAISHNNEMQLNEWFYKLDEPIELAKTKTNAAPGVIPGYEIAKNSIDFDT
jgi:hypothetical protein